MVPSAPLAVARAGAPVRRRRAAPAAPAAALSRPAGRRASGPLACTCSLGSAGGPPAPRRAAPRPPAAIAPPPPGVAPAPPSPSNGAAAPDALPIVLPEDLVVAPGVVVPVKRDNTAPACDFNGYLRKILTARVYELAVETPLELAPRLSERLGNGNSVLLKREDMQPVFSFKLRGAYNRIAQLSPETLAAGVVTASAGNHAQGVALSAQRLGVSAVVCMPVTTPAIKVESVKRMGATVRLVGDTFDETNAFARALADDEGRAFIPPFDNPDVIAGQGTVGMEILRQCGSQPLHAIFVPVGGGGLIAGIAAYVKCVRPEVLVIGVEPAGANAMAQSLKAGRRVTLAKVDGFADGVAVKTVGAECFRVAQQLVDGTVLVDTDAICAAIKDVFEDTRSILEPAGALALAGAKAYLAAQGRSDCRVVAVTSGANMNFDRLRLVSELADVGLRQEAVLATTIPEAPGSFKRFAAVVAGSGGSGSAATDITEFKYRFAGAGAPARVLYSVALRGAAPLEALLGRLAQAGLPTVDLSANDVAKVHLRHLVGGAAAVAHERLLKVEFPEKPGALGRFLDVLSPRWNITLFHYRNAGGNVAKVLVGAQVPPAEADEFAQALATVGYDFKDETDNEAFTMFQRGHEAPAATPQPAARWPWQR